MAATQGALRRRLSCPTSDLMKRPILLHPDPRLKKQCAAVPDLTDELRKLADDMLETMYDAPGIGLAATQVDVHKKVVVMDVSEDSNEPMVFINPEVSILEGELEKMQEGCLSVPGFYEDVERAESVTISAQDEHGKPFELTADDLLAVCIQHEIDHLDGKLFVDYLSPLKRNRIRKKLVRMDKERAEQTTQSNSL